MNKMKCLVLMFLLFLSSSSSETTRYSNILPPKYLLYDINFPEGFNLRRDVYMRLAVFMKNDLIIDSTDHWHLVLPPWYRLYHWRSRDIGDQSLLPWSHFFDVESMKRYVPVVEMQEFLEDNYNGEIDMVYALQNFEDAFSDENWTWEEKWDFKECSSDHRQNYKQLDINFKGWFWGLSNLTSRDVMCVAFQGHAHQLKELLDSTDDRVIMVDRAEVVLHDQFGNSEYWKCRRSMRFASHLVLEASKFREQFFNSTDELDNTVLPKFWEDEVVHRTAIGGNYLGVHLRRRDFVESRSSEVPNLEIAASIIRQKLLDLQLSHVFVATDAPEKEIMNLKTLLSEFSVLTYKPDYEKRKKLLDGGIAIVEQIICSHARYFIGSYESTFSFRIHEEREILGFPTSTTFNRFCSSKKKCTQPSQWLITH